MISPYFYFCTLYNRQMHSVPCSLYNHKIADVNNTYSVKINHFKNFVSGPGQK